MAGKKLGAKVPCQKEVVADDNIMTAKQPSEPAVSVEKVAKRKRDIKATPEK